MKWFQYSFLCSAAVISFLFYALPYYPFLDSDIAVHVYMAENFRFPDDLYFWNQDRLGSLAPLIAYVVNICSPLNAAWSVSITEWFFLICCCVLSWYFISSPLLRVLITVLWFFPNFEMRCLFLPSHPYNEQLAIIFASLVLIDKSVVRAFRPLYLPLISLLILASLWVSEFSLLFFILLIPVFFNTFKKHLILNFHSSYISIIAAGVILVSGIFGLLSIKAGLPQENQYMRVLFAHPNEMLSSAQTLFQFIMNNLMFDGYIIFNSILLYTLTPLLLLRFMHSTHGWSRYFLLVATIGTVLLISLRWVHINAVMLKYFIPVIMAMWMFVLSLNPSVKTHFRLTYYSLACIAVFASAFSFQKPYSKFYQESITYTDLKSLSSLPHHHFLGDYWHAYVLGIADPSTIVATPHMKDVSRHKLFKHAVLNSDSLYVVSNNWLDAFPDTLLQGNFSFVAVNDEIVRIGSLEMKLYASIKSY